MVFTPKAFIDLFSSAIKKQINALKAAANGSKLAKRQFYKRSLIITLSANLPFGKRGFFILCQAKNAVSKSGHLEKNNSAKFLILFCTRQVVSAKAPGTE